MTVHYDHTIQGLLVEATEEELQTVATNVCAEGGNEELLEGEIHHVAYRVAMPAGEGKRRAIAWLIGMSLFWAGSLAILVAGLYQIGRWILDWGY